MLYQKVASLSFILFSWLTSYEATAQEQPIFSPIVHQMTPDRVISQINRYGADTFFLYLGRTTTLEAAYAEAMGLVRGKDFSQTTIGRLRQISSLHPQMKEKIFDIIIPSPEQLGKKKLVISRTLIFGNTMQVFIPELLNYLSEKGYPEKFLIFDFIFGHGENVRTRAESLLTDSQSSLFREFSIVEDLGYYQHVSQNALKSLTDYSPYPLVEPTPLFSKEYSKKRKISQSYEALRREIRQQPRVKQFCELVQLGSLM